MGAGGAALREMIALLPNFGAEEGDEGAIGHRADLQVAALLWRELFPADARLIGVESEEPRRFGPGAAFPWIPTEGGVPWLSTAKAERRLSRMGLGLAGPDPAVVGVVHDKAFALRAARSLGLCPLGDTVRIFDPDELDALPAALAALPAGEWAVKPRFGSSGRGRIPIHGGVTPVLGNACARLARRGGAVLEPWLDRVLDLSVQLHVGEEVELLGSTRQVLSPSGIYVGNRCVVDGSGLPRAGTRWDDALEAAGLRIGAAAAAAGFRGPCGIDAFVYRDRSGAEVLRPVVELNARYTMGTVALGILRRLAEMGELGDARSYLFTLRPPALTGVRGIPLIGGAAALLSDDPDAGLI